LPAVGGRSDVLSRCTAAREGRRSTVTSAGDQAPIPAFPGIGNCGYPCGFVGPLSVRLGHSRLLQLDDKSPSGCMRPFNRWIVVPVAEGSNPSTHPRIKSLALEIQPLNSRL